MLTRRHADHTCEPVYAVHALDPAYDLPPACRACSALAVRRGIQLEQMRASYDFVAKQLSLVEQRALQNAGGLHD